MDLFGLTNFQIGLLGFPALLLLGALRVPLAAALTLVGVAGLYAVEGNLRAIDSTLKTVAFNNLTSYSYSIIPLFLLMGEFAVRGGMSTSLFAAANAWLGHRKGGVAMAAIGASAGFGAVCGSSLATTSTIGKAALPELRRLNYSKALATGALAAGGTLGILIPPSFVLVIFAVIADQNIESLFRAALVPGLIAVAGYLCTTSLVAQWVRSAGQSKARMPWAQRWLALRHIWPVVLIFVLVIGGIYSGAFTPTAGAAVGAAGTGVIAWRRGGLDGPALRSALLDVAKVSGMIFLIIIGAGVFNTFLGYSALPKTLATFFADTSFNPWLILIGMLLLYFVLGMVMDSVAMILLTVPIFFPIILQLDFGLSTAEVGLWFGVLVLMAVEVGLITPPMGMNLFVINNLDRSVPMAQTYRGVLPYVASDLVRIGVLVAFPEITLALVRVLG